MRWFPVSLRPGRHSGADGQPVGRLGSPRQIIVLAALISILAAVVLVFTVQLVLAGLSTRTADQVLANRAAALATSVRAASRGRTLTVPSSVLDVGVAVYDGRRCARDRTAARAPRGRLRPLEHVDS